MTRFSADRLSGGWRVSRDPTSAHTAWSNDFGFLFASPAWAEVLRTLDAEPWFAWHPDWEIGAVVPVFRRLGLRIGFLGFPVSAAAFEFLGSERLNACAVEVATAASLDLTRITQSQCNDLFTHVTSARPEVWVDDLQTWCAARHKRLRKDLSFANRAAPRVLLMEGGVDAATCYRLHASTIARQAGRLKYNQEYFAALGELASESPFLEIVSAMEEGRVRGYAVLAINGGVANYLHGAVDADGRRQGLSDLLLARLLELGKRAGCSRFTLMASPWEQEGLVNFKSKWANARGLTLTQDIPFTLAGRFVRLAARWQGRSDRHAATHWTAER